jgi:protein FrlC
MQKISEAGFEGFELWGGQFHGHCLDFLADGSNIAERKIDNRKIGFVKDTARKFGLELVCYTPEQYLYPLNYLADDILPFDADTNKQRCVDHLKLCIDVAKALGMQSVLLATPYSPWIRDKNGHRAMAKAEAFEMMAQYAEELTRYAEKSHMNLLLEAMPHIGIATAVETLEDTIEMLRRVNSPNLQVILDTGHHHVTATRTGLDPNESLVEHVNKLGDKLTHVHIDDNLGNTDSHLAPGDGNIDFNPLLEALEKTKYSGYLSLELDILGPNALPPQPEKLVKKSKEFLINLMNK